MPRKTTSFGASFDTSFQKMSGGFDRGLTDYKQKIAFEALRPYQFFPPGEQPEYSPIRFYDQD